MLNVQCVERVKALEFVSGAMLSTESDQAHEDVRDG